MATKKANGQKKTPILTPVASVMPSGPAVQPAAPTTTNGASEEVVRALAYRKWEAAGRPEGDGMIYWLEAEREINHS